MKTLIIAIPVEYGDARKVCELVENGEFETTKELREYLIKELDEEDIKESISIYEISDFMDDCNDEYFNLDSYFISYVSLK